MMVGTQYVLKQFWDKHINYLQGYQFAYTKYLEEVVKILESDPKFNERLKNMKEEDIKVFYCT